MAFMANQDELLENETQEETPETTPESIRIGEKEYTIDTLSELVNKGEDYTRKTMALADERREIERLKEEAEQYRQMKSLYEQNPDEFFRVLSSTHPNKQRSQSFDMDVDLDSLTENEKLLYQQNQELKRVFSPLLKEVEELRTTVSEKLAYESAIHELAKQGVKTDMYELQQCVRSQGVNDPLKAWKLAQFESGNRSEKPKPETMKSEQSRVIPYSEWGNKKGKWSVEKVEEALRNGVQFEPPPK